MEIEFWLFDSSMSDFVTCIEKRKIDAQEQDIQETEMSFDAHKPACKVKRLSIIKRRVLTYS